jgi:hypothetical protein
MGLTLHQVGAVILVMDHLDISQEIVERRLETIVIVLNSSG